jgi:hypothetical protein
MFATELQFRSVELEKFGLAEDAVHVLIHLLSPVASLRNTSLTKTRPVRLPSRIQDLKASGPYY